MERADKNDPDSRLALVLFRYLLLLDQRDFARAADIAQSQLSVYERGERAAPREVLERAASAAGFPVHLLDSLLGSLRAFRAVARGKSRAERVMAQGMAAEIISLLYAVTDLILEQPEERTPEEQDAEALWADLAECAASERRVLVEELQEYWTADLCVRVASESIQKAPNHPSEALELAELALLIAERISGEPAKAQHLQGYAWAHISNARRTCNDLPGAEAALTKAWELWEADPHPSLDCLNEAWLPWISAAILREQRRFPEALKRIDEALALDRGELKPEILLSKSAIYQILGDPEGSAAALSEAAPLIDPVREPRLAFGVRFNLAVDLCHLGSFAEAETRLPEVKALAERLGGELDLARVDWLEGKTAAGLGRTDAARAAFERTRRVFLRRDLAFDYALVSLELAVLLLSHDRTQEVKSLAEEMVSIFRTQKVERETLAALRLFWDAAGRESATVELARRVVTFLRRAQHDPELRFVG